MEKLLCTCLIATLIGCCSSQSETEPSYPQLLQEVTIAVTQVQQRRVDPRHIANNVLREIRDEFTRVQWDIQRGAFQMYDVALRWHMFQHARNQNTTSCISFYNARLQKEMSDILDRARDDCYFKANQIVQGYLEKYEIPSADGLMEDVKVMYNRCANEEPCMEMTRSYASLKVQEYKMLVDNVGMLVVRDVRQQSTGSTGCLYSAVSNALSRANLVSKEVQTCMEKVVAESTKPVPA